LCSSHRYPSLPGLSNTWPQALSFLLSDIEKVAFCISHIQT
jgi:hypothetical protein